MSSYRWRKSLEWKCIRPGRAATAGILAAPEFSCGIRKDTTIHELAPLVPSEPEGSGLRATLRANDTRSMSAILSCDYRS